MEEINNFGIGTTPTKKNYIFICRTSKNRKRMNNAGKLKKKPVNNIDKPINTGCTIYYPSNNGEQISGNVKYQPK